MRRIPNKLAMCICSGAACDDYTCSPLIGKVLGQTNTLSIRRYEYHSPLAVSKLVNAGRWKNRNWEWHIQITKRNRCKLGRGSGFNKNNTSPKTKSEICCDLRNYVLNVLYNINIEDFYLLRYSVM
jgi:hypothetical protein